jgi:hypothetical protein
MSWCHRMDWEAQRAVHARRLTRLDHRSKFNLVRIKPNAKLVNFFITGPDMFAYRISLGFWRGRSSRRCRHRRRRPMALFVEISTAHWSEQFALTGLNIGAFALSRRAALVGLGSRSFSLATGSTLNDGTYSGQKLAPWIQSILIQEHTDLFSTGRQRVLFCHSRRRRSRPTQLARIERRNGLDKHLGRLGARSRGRRCGRSGAGSRRRGGFFEQRARSVCCDLRASDHACLGGRRVLARFFDDLLGFF